MRSRKYLAVFSILIVLFAGKCAREATIPDELIGVWKTLAFKYRDTFFELRKKAITFGTKEGDINTYTIKNIKRKKNRNDEWISYTVYYQNEYLQKSEFHFYYNSSQNGLIRSKNQQNLVWRKVKQ